MTNDSGKPPLEACRDAVVVEGLSRSFGSVLGLDDVNLRIPVGSVFGLVGLNGAGKTTLIRHLVGSFAAQRGRVRVLGEDPTVRPEVLLQRIGYLTEEDSLPTWIRVGDLIDFTRSLYPTWDDVYAQQLCELFAISRAARMRSLSKGQRARVGLLMAIGHRPELLLLDEPSRGLDPIARQDILEAVIRTISQDGRTVLFSSHLLDEVQRVCDSVAVMQAGKILESLKLEQLETQYVEIICRPPSGWTRPPDEPAVFGWERSAEEWSAVVDQSQFAGDEMDWQSRYHVIEHRSITMDRWFSARCRQATSGEAIRDQGPSRGEAAHV